MKGKIGFIGAGTVATTFAIKLAEGGYPVVAVADIKPAMAQGMAELVQGCKIYDTNQGVVDAADLVIVATQEQFMIPVVNEINWHPNKGVIHTSGLFGLEILESAKCAGAMIGGLHPCQVFADLNQALKALPGSGFCLLGEPPLLDTLKEIVSTFNGSWIVLKSEQKPLYHAALAFTGDFTAVCVKITTELFKKFGMSPPETTKIITPILKGTLDAIINLGFPYCFSCPVTRGDLNVVSKHIAALEENEPGLVELFKELDLHIVPMALAKGTIDEATAEKLRVLLQE